jgi:hypothetical protein
MLPAPAACITNWAGSLRVASSKPQRWGCSRSAKVGWNRTMRRLKTRTYAKSLALKIVSEEYVIIKDTRTGAVGTTAAI